jgi:hypothetical protein
VLTNTSLLLQDPSAGLELHRDCNAVVNFVKLILSFVTTVLYTKVRSASKRRILLFIFVFYFVFYYYYSSSVRYAEAAASLHTAARRSVNALY